MKNVSAILRWGLAWYALHLLACTPGKHIVLNPATVPLDTFEIIVVERVEVATSAQQLMQQIPLELQLAIVEELKKRDFNASIVADSSLKSVLLIKPYITHFEPGSPMEAHLAIGIGPGKARLVVKMEFIDREKQKVVAVIEGTGHKQGRVYGGLGDQLMMARRVAMQLTEYLEKEQLTPPAKSYRK